MKKIIGHIGVDSGQVLICDPCYIDSEWKNEEFNIPRRYQHNDGTVIQYEKDFPHYEAVIPQYGKTVNQLIKDKDVVELPDDIPSEHPFSYNACCKKTLGKDTDGQLNFEMGHPGVGVVSNTGYGDGYYPVVAEYNKEGQVKSLTIKFIFEEDE